MWLTIIIIIIVIIITYRSWLECGCRTVGVLHSVTHIRGLTKESRKKVTAVHLNSTEARDRQHLVFDEIEIPSPKPPYQHVLPTTGGLANIAADLPHIPTPTPQRNSTAAAITNVTATTTMPGELFIPAERQLDEIAMDQYTMPVEFAVIYSSLIWYRWHMASWR